MKSGIDRFVRTASAVTVVLTGMFASTLVHAAGTATVPVSQATRVTSARALASSNQIGGSPNQVGAATMTGNAGQPATPPATRSGNVGSKGVHYQKGK